MENNNNVNGVLGALGYGALPQSIVGPLTTTQNTVQRTQYNPAKLQSLIDALKAEHSKMSAGEALANALSNTPQAQSFKGGFGEEIVNPWMVGLTSMARSYGDAYGARAAAAREKEEKEREDAIKAAQVDLDANKQNITDQTNTQYMKVNDPNAKSAQEQAKVTESLNALRALKERNRENVVGFDEAFDVKNPDGTVNVEKTMANYVGRNPHGLFGRNWTSPNSFWGWGESRGEADTRQKFQAFKETQLRNVYDTLRGAGAITEKELETMGKTAQKATNPYELELAIDEFIKNIEAKQGTKAINGYTIETIE